MNVCVSVFIVNVCASILCVSVCVSFLPSGLLLIVYPSKFLCKKMLSSPGRRELAGCVASGQKI